MKSDEARIAEAIASLTARLTSWQVEDAPARAHEFVTDMLRFGWRPTAPATVHSLRPDVTTPAPPEFRAARAAMRRDDGPAYDQPAGRLDGREVSDVQLPDEPEEIA